MIPDLLIVFDLDDTLVDTSDVYWRARSAFVELISSTTGMGNDTIIDAFERIDSEFILTSGFASGRYEQTMLKTYSLFCSNTPTSDLLESIKACARIIQTDLPKPLPGARELLEWTSSRFRLALITRGERDLQLRKLQNVRFDRFFEVVRVVKRKEAAAFSAVIKEQGFTPDNTWVIGDSIGADINPGLEAGAKCIRYAYNHASYHWDPDSGVEPIGPFFQTSDLNTIIEILQSPSTFEMENVRFSIDQ